MKKYSLSAIAMSVLLASTTHAASTSTNPSNSSLNQQQLKAMIETIVNQRTAQLQNQVNQLQHQVVVLKSRLQRQQTLQGASTLRRVRVKSTTRIITTSNVPVEPIGMHAEEYHYGTQAYYPEDHIPPIHTGASEPQHPRYNPIHARSPHAAAANNVLTSVYLAGTPVYTSPYIGIHSAYDGSNLIVNASKVNLDTRLLKQTQAMQDALAKEGLPYPKHPVVELSGDLEPAGFISKTSPGSTNGDIDLPEARIDLFAQLNPCVFGFFSLKYDNTPTTPFRVGNSRVVLDQGFVTLGNLAVTHLYSSAGQMYVPFGQYSSYFVSDPLTQLMGRTKARAFNLGFYPPGESGLYASSYVFHADTTSDKGTGAGMNGGFKAQLGNLTANLAAGYISTIADSEGMQVTGAPDNILFKGFSTSEESENLVHTVPGFDTYGELDYLQFTLISEYLTATRRFDPRDLSFNAEGAQPSAFHVEGVYNFNIHGKPGSFGLSYGFTEQALALLLPRERYMAVINYAFWRDTVASLEFRHDKNYNENFTASGGKIPQIFGPQNNWVNTVTAQLAVYF